MARLLAAVVVVAAAVAVWSCVYYDASLLLDSPRDAAVEVGVGVDAAPEAGCVIARWPARPQIDDVPGGGTIELVNAVRTVDYGIGRDAGIPRDFGFDLDGVCTCPGVESCRTLPNAERHCDLDQGRDTEVSKLLETFSTVSPAFSQSGINESLSAGYYGLLVRVRRYNGTANDPSVEVAVFNSSGSQREADGGAPIRPRWDGTDTWTVDPASAKGAVGPPYEPVYVDVNAYVAGWSLVATIDFPLTLGTIAGQSTVTVDLKGSVVSGVIVPDGQTFRIDHGVFAGRWPTARLLPSLAVLPDPFDPSHYLCGDASASYDGIKALVCDGQDIVSDVRQDMTGAPCDAVSLSVAFTAGVARLGELLAIPPPVQPCGPQWTDDCPR